MQYEQKIVYQELDNILNLFPEDFSGIFGFNNDVFWFIEDIINNDVEMTNLVGATASGNVVFQQLFTTDDNFYQIIMEYLLEQGIDFGENLVEIENKNSAGELFDNGALLRIKWRSIENHEGLALPEVSQGTNEDEMS